MARPARFTNEQIVAATARMAAKHGPAGATVARIARVLRAPTGSIYHRFASRDVLLGEVWLRATASFQNAVAERLAGPEPHAAGLNAALYVPKWIREHPIDARILLLHRREDFLDRGWPAPMRTRARELSLQLSEVLHGFCQRLLGRSDAEALRIVTFALAQAPLAAVRPHVEVDESPPPIVDALIQETYRVVIALGGAVN